MLNTTRPPLDDVRVRQALSLALDREEITRVATAAGEVAGLQPGAARACRATRSRRVRRAIPKQARKLLAEAGYPDGRGFPKLEIHYNTDQEHQTIAELVRKQWQRELGITASLRNEEWGSLQESQQQMKYMVSRRAWVGDYLDPNTFLDMFVTDGENNSTGFSNAEYDQLIADAAKEPDAAKRMRDAGTGRADADGRDADHSRLLLRVAKHGEAARPRLLQQSAGPPSAHAIWIDPHVDPNDPAAERIHGSRCQ